MTQPETVRTVFLSDLHIGYRGFDAAGLILALSSFAPPEQLYLVGDIVDGWKIKKRWFWQADYTKLLDLIALWGKTGTKITYITGNHDEKIRHILPFRRHRFRKHTGVAIKNICIHKTLRGERFVVMHGDQFDNRIVRTSSHIGDRVYDWFVDMFGLPAHHPDIVVDGELKPFSLSKTILHGGTHSARKLVGNFERAIARLSKTRGTDGLICGHSHVGILKRLNPACLYANCGTWVGHEHTLLVEDATGLLSVRHFARSQPPVPYINISPMQAVQSAQHPETAQAILAICKLWRHKQHSLAAVYRAWRAHHVSIIPKSYGA